MEKARLPFFLGDPRKRFDLISSYNRRVVGLCDGQFCFSCNPDERGKLVGFDGGPLEVMLQLQSRTNPFGPPREYYLAHLVFVPEQEKEEIITGAASDEAIEFDASYNAVLYICGGTRVLVDPGSMALTNGSVEGLAKLIEVYRPTVVIITHGHQDHWRNLDLLEKLGIPVYLTPLPNRLISHTARIEKNYALQKILRKGRAQLIDPGDTIDLGEMKIFTFPVPHTIPEAMGLLLAGERRAVHLGDFRLGEGVEKAEIITTLRAIAKRKVDFVAVNVVNCHLEGYAEPESMVVNSITNVMVEAKGRVVVTCFSTNVERIGSIAEVAQAQGRNVYFLGTGMRRAHLELAREGLEYGGDENDISQPNSLIFVSGCQAEENSILERTLEERPPYQPQESDTLVFSSRDVPGNEVPIRALIQKLTPKVSTVFIYKGERIRIGLEENQKIKEIDCHATGHGKEKDTELVILDTLQPKEVLPIPQEGEGFEAFKEMAEGVGIKIISERVVEI